MGEDVEQLWDSADAAARCGCGDVVVLYVFAVEYGVFGVSWLFDLGGDDDQRVEQMV